MTSILEFLISFNLVLACISSISGVLLLVWVKHIVPKDVLPLGSFLIIITSLLNIVVSINTFVDHQSLNTDYTIAQEVRATINYLGALLLIGLIYLSLLIHDNHKNEVSFLLSQIQEHKKQIIKFLKE